jgi:hypothetical protein
MMSPKKEAAQLKKGDVIVKGGSKTEVKDVKDFGNRIIVVDKNGAETRHNPADEVEVEDKLSDGSTGEQIPEGVQG